MKHIIAIPLGTAALVGLIACSNPDNATEGSNSSSPELDAGENNSIRENQIESDERARQQREDVLEGQAPQSSEEIAPDAEMSSDRQIVDTIQAKLEAQLPDNQLTVESTEGNVTISGEVASEIEMQQAKSLAAETEGVQSVDMQVSATPDQQE